MWQGISCWCLASEHFCAFKVFAQLSLLITYGAHTEHTRYLYKEGAVCMVQTTFV